MSRNTTMIPKRISSIRFGLMDPTEIRKMSAVEVKTADTYKDDGRAYSQGLMDMHSRTNTVLKHDISNSTVIEILLTQFGVIRVSFWFIVQ